MLFNDFLILFHDIPCDSKLLPAITWCSLLFYAIPQYSIIFHDIPPDSMVFSVYSALFHAIPLPRHSFLLHVCLVCHLFDAIPRCSMLSLTIPRYFILFALFRHIQSYSRLFHDILGHFTIFQDIPYSSTLFRKIHYYSTLLHNIIFHDIPYYSMAFQLCYGIPWYLMISILFHDIPCDSKLPPAITWCTM